MNYVDKIEQPKSHKVQIIKEDDKAGELLSQQNKYFVCSRRTSDMNVIYLYTIADKVKKKKKGFGEHTIHV